MKWVGEQLLKVIMLLEAICFSDWFGLYAELFVQFLALFFKLCVLFFKCWDLLRYLLKVRLSLRQLLFQLFLSLYARFLERLQSLDFPPQFNLLVFMHSEWLLLNPFLFESRSRRSEPVDWRSHCFSHSWPGAFQVVRHHVHYWLS